MRRGAKQLPFADGAFDYVTCIGAIERFLDRDKALLEMHGWGDMLSTFIEMARESGVTFFACATTMGVMDVAEEDLIDGVTLAGSPAMLEIVKEGAHTLSF